MDRRRRRIRALGIQQDQPVTWLIDAVPFCLGVIGALLGAGCARFVQLQTDTASIAERIVDEWTEEIHNSNAEIARSADSTSLHGIATDIRSWAHQRQQPHPWRRGCSSSSAAGRRVVFERTHPVAGRSRGQGALSPRLRSAPAQSRPARRLSSASLLCRIRWLGRRSPGHRAPSCGVVR